MELSQQFRLSWSHYQILMSLNNPNERSFYEIEATTNHWRVRELERQIASSLFERLALSRDPDEIKRLAS
jgi:predicted nuclease of restriction endonuclease-like (RecB) superfamily